MANFSGNPIVSAITGYIDESREELLAKALLGPVTVKYMNVMGNVKGETALHLLDTEVVLQDGSVCGWNPQGSNEISKKTIKPKYLKVNTEWCDKEFLDTYAGYKVQIAAGIKTLPYEEEFLADIVKHVNNKLETMVWQGSTAKTNEFGGLLEILAADSASTVNVSAATGTTAYDFLRDVYMNIPQEILTGANIFVSDTLYREFLQDMVDKNYYHYPSGNDAAEGFYLPATNVRIIPVHGLNGTSGFDYAIAAEQKNLVYATNLVGDENKLEFWFSEDARTHRLAIEFMAGAGIVFPDEIVVGKRAK